VLPRIVFELSGLRACCFERTRQTPPVLITRRDQGAEFVILGAGARATETIQLVDALVARHELVERHARASPVIAPVETITTRR